VLVQPQLPHAESCEVIIGMKRDVSFGPVVLFGYGGGLVEFFHDVACGIAPLTLNEAQGMIGRIHTAPLLHGFDVDAIARAIVQVSQLSLAYPEISSLDMNPMMVFRAGKGATIVDVRILV
jgi:acyl-CoA synthetase (NDP forming)